MEKQEYEKSVLEYEDVKDAMDYHHRLGIEEGFQKGLEEGIEKGRAMLLQTAHNLLKMGVSVQDVAKATSLDENTVRNLIE